MNKICGCKKKLYILKLCGSIRPAPYSARTSSGYVGASLNGSADSNKQPTRVFLRAAGRPAPLCHPYHKSKKSQKVTGDGSNKKTHQLRI